MHPRWLRRLGLALGLSAFAASGLAWALHRDELPAAPTTVAIGARLPGLQLAGTSGEPDSYVVPAAVDTPAFAPTTELANYVVAHSEYSTPLNRRSLLSSFVSSEFAQPPAAAPPQSGDSARDRPNAER